MSVKLKFCLDRVESDIAVCLCEDEQDRAYQFVLDRVPALRGLADGTLFEAVMGEDGLPRDVRVLSEETEARRASNRARLQALFDRSKRKN